ncbi:hypothetical protein QOZ80_6BG0489620 [Eleusine coracana subsp. coracana]|nr:hypothetical protein QOZ80_6BG0489620 [Eleusine coracana subsp. coracana]
MVAGMLSRIRLLVGIVMGVFKSGGLHNPSPRSSTTDDKETLISPRPPPELNDDATAEILLRLSSDEPAYLVRASLVCKTWYQILSDPAFNRRYRKFHGAPPLLGFFHNINYDSRMNPVPHFIPTTTTAIRCSPPVFTLKDWWFLDCRHDRVLMESVGRIIVWDLITNRQKHLPVPRQRYYWEPVTAAVLCAKDGCDHLNCNRDSFLVVSIGNNYTNNFIWVRVYSSETNAWSKVIRTTIPQFSFVDMRPSLLVRDAFYFSIENGRQILKYDLGGQCLSIIDGPGEPRGIVVIADDGGLGFASVEGYDLRLWSQHVGISGIMEWVQCRVIELGTLLQIPAQLFAIDVIGFAEAARTIFISTNVGIFILDLNSNAVRNVGMTGAYHAAVPYTSYYTPGCWLNHEEAVTINEHQLATAGSSQSG